MWLPSVAISHRAALMVCQFPCGLCHKKLCCLMLSLCCCRSLATVGGMGDIIHLTCIIFSQNTQECSSLLHQIFNYVASLFYEFILCAFSLFEFCLSILLF